MEDHAVDLYVWTIIDEVQKIHLGGGFNDLVVNVRNPGNVFRLQLVIEDR